MKKKYLSKITLMSLLLILVFIVNVYAASSYYQYDMSYRVVDGKRNGEFHILDSGNAYISGSHYTYASDQVFAPKENIHYTLVKNGLFDKTIGTITITGEDTSFQRNFGTIEGGRYYLQVYKVNIDYHKVRGSGRLYN